MILDRDINLFNRSNSGLRILEWDRIQKKCVRKKSPQKKSLREGSGVGLVLG